MEPSFNCRRVEHVFTNDFYIKEADVKDESKRVTEYGKILGTIFEFLGFAFKAIDDKGQISYLNKDDFVNYLCDKGNELRKKGDLPGIVFVDKGIDTVISKTRIYSSIDKNILRHIFDDAVNNADPSNVKELGDGIVEHINNPFVNAFW